MLQEATKLLNSAFQSSFIKRLSLYLHDCVREEVKSSTFRNLKQDKDNKWMFLEGEESLFSSFSRPLSLDGASNQLTDLMIQSEMSQKEKYLIYGYLFLRGRATKSKKKGEFLTPLLYMPCKLERDGLKINCTLTEETLSLNTGALSALIQNEDEDEAEFLFEGLLDVVPDLPLTEEKLQIFLTTLKSIIPFIDIEDFKKEHALLETGKPKNVIEEVIEENLKDDDSESEEEEKIVISKNDKLAVRNQAAIILTKRPSITAGLLHELTKISEKPSGIFRETALGIINQEFLSTKESKLIENTTKKYKELKDFVPITPLALSDSQESVIEAIENNPLIAVYGPPGTGKSQTIVNLVSHLVASGKTVLVASRMDKAVDVVTDRLNGLGAPFLALRAGRPNYQKQLNFQLQDLLSNKVDLDSDFENSILVSPKDMTALFKQKKELEEKCRSIINLEHDWNDLRKIKKKQEEVLGQPEFIKNRLTGDKIQHFRSLIEKIETAQNSSGFLSAIQVKLSTHTLSKQLELKNVEFFPEVLEKLKQELQLAEMLNKLKLVESDINKIGNLHMLLEQIRELRKKQKKLAIEILKNERRDSLKGILRDQIKRQRLIVHSKALVERKKNLQSRLLEDEDFKPLLDAFPCWAVTTYAISSSLPLKPGLFDVAIIDEASQCDIASCFPVLFRAKKAVIVGDDKQLPHLSFLEKAKEQSFLSQHEIPDKYQLMWRFRTNSMFDLANYYSTSPVLLDEHFRSVPPIIDFSNREFYGNRIRIMNKDTDIKQCIELNVVKDALVDLDTTRNMAETEQILKKVQELIIEDQKSGNSKPVTIGVISPFRGQVDLIQKAISQVLSESTIKKHKFEVGTAHTFQGDEKDIILLSFLIAPNSHFQSLTFLQKPNLFNVSITRAKKRLICFISKDPKDLPNGLLRSYLEYIQEYMDKDKKLSLEVEENLIDDNIYKNKFEKDVADFCRNNGLTVKAGFETAGFSADLVVSDGINSIIVECDGVEDENSKNVNPIKKQTILERCGWKVMRITIREWLYSKNTCFDRIKAVINNEVAI